MPNCKRKAGATERSRSTRTCGAFKAFLNWCYDEQIVKERFKLSWLKEEQKIIATFSAEHIRKLINWKPVKRSDCRLHLLVLTALDTGLRVEELISLARPDVNLTDCTLTVRGKGGRHRVVPISLELRKALYRYFAKHSHPLVFCTLQGVKLSKRNLLRDFKELCQKLNITGVRCSFHTLRHSFSVNYLRNGGNLEYLRRILGHTQLATTQKYLRSLGVEDLGAVHNGLSPLSARA